MQTKQIKVGYERHIKELSVTKENKRLKIRVIIQYLTYLTTIKKTPKTAKARHIEGYLSLFTHLSPSAYNHHVSVLRGFQHYLYQQGITDIDWSEHLIYKKYSRLLPRNIPLNLMIQLCTPTADEIRQLDSSILMLRDQAIIEFLFSTGVRSAELLDTKIKDLSYDWSECFIPTKKKGVPRYVYLGKPAQQALKRYLQQREITDLQTLKKNQHEQPIFLNQQGNRLSYTSLRKIISHTAIKRIGTHVTPHMFRHTFATELLRSSGCLRSVQIMLGHTSIASTQRYCHLDIQDRMKAIDEFHPRSQKSNKFDK